MKKRYNLYNAITFLVVLFFCLPVTANAACRPYVVKTAKNVRGTEIDLYEIVGNDIIKSLRKPSLAIKPDNFPLTLQECGDATYYLWKSPQGNFLIKKSLFKCISLGARVGKNKDMFAGAPGSGSDNKACPK